MKNEMNNEDQMHEERINAFINEIESMSNKIIVDDNAIYIRYDDFGGGFTAEDIADDDAITLELKETIIKMIINNDWAYSEADDYDEGYKLLITNYCW